MTDRQKVLEFELPGKIMDAVRDYLGVRKLNALSSKARLEVAEAAANCAAEITRTIATDGETVLRDPPST